MTTSTLAIKHGHVGSKTYVLVHGAYHGGWCWKGVAEKLRSLGHAVFTPTLTGLGERSHLINMRPHLETFITDVSQVLECEEIEDAILVGHSFAGSVISGVADRVPHRLRHLVYLDALILQDGESSYDRNPEKIENYRRRAVDASSPDAVPPKTPADFGVTDPRLASWLEQKLSAQPLAPYFDRLELEHPVGNGIRSTYIACSQPLFPSLEESRDRARGYPSWTYLEFPASHSVMLEKPAQLAELLSQLD